MITITINERTKAGKMLLELAKMLSSNNKGVIITETGLEKPVSAVGTESALSTKDKAFLKRLKRSAQHAKEIGAGTRKGKSLDALLDEL